MAVTYVGTGGGNGLNTTINFSYTVGAGTNRLLMFGALSGSVINSASYNSVSMTQVASMNGGNVKAFALTGPASGSNTLSVTLSAYDILRWRADDFTDVDQTTPTGTAVTNSGTSTAPTTGSVAISGGGAVWGYANHLYSSALTATAGTLAGASTGTGTSWASSYRTTTGALSWSASQSASWVAIGVPLVSATVAAPTITVQPSNQTATAGNTAAFGVTATSSGGALSYQWQRSVNSGGSWSNVTTGTGGTSASYTTATTTVSGGNANNGDQYRVIVTDSNGSTTSSAASLTVNAAAATGYSMTGPSSGVVGAASSNFTVTLTPSGGTASATTITPSSGGGGGTFTPSTVSLSTGTPSATFTYTPASAGVKTISVTNSGSLSNPGNISFTASASSTKGGAILALLAGKVL